MLRWSLVGFCWVVMGCRDASMVERSATASTSTPTSTATATSTSTSAATATSTAAPGSGACGDGMAFIPKGTVHTLEAGKNVEVDAFCLDRFEISVARFRAAVETGLVKRECRNGADCTAVPNHTAWPGPGAENGSSDEDTVVSRFCNGQKKNVDDQPVNCVSVIEAKTFCEQAGARLPTGDEWELAAHRDRPTPWGTPVAKDEPCWGKPHKRTGTCAIGTQPKDQTPEGVFDLGGNVSEWVTSPKRAGTNPVRWAYGASWYAVDDGYVRAALGGFQMPAVRAETVGFRCAKSPNNI